MEKEDLISLQRNVLKLRVEGKYEETIEACFQLLEAGLTANDPKSILTIFRKNSPSSSV